MPCGRVPRDDIEIWADLVHQLHTGYVVDENGCWVWQGQHFGNGYGRLARHLPRAGLSMRAHIAQYQFYFGEIPEGLFVCHKCDVKNCINIDHLWLGTNQENQLDGVKKGRIGGPNHYNWGKGKREPRINAQRVRRVGPRRTGPRRKGLMTEEGKRSFLEAIAAYWTPERRAEKSKAMSGKGNPMYGLVKEEAPCFGRTGGKHPMFGKHHTEEAKQKISEGLLATHAKKQGKSL